MSDIKFTIQTSQRDAVYRAFMEAFSEHGLTLDDLTLAKDVLTSEIRKRIYEILEDGLKDGRVFLKPTANNLKKISNKKELRTYVIGLVNNWGRKHPGLNGSGKKKSS